MSEDGFWRDLWVIWFARGLCCSVLPAALEAVAFAVHLQDVDVVGGRSSNPPVSRSEPKISVHSSKDRLVLTMMDPRSSMISRLNQYSCRVSWADALRYRDPSIRAPRLRRWRSPPSLPFCRRLGQSQRDEGLAAAAVVDGDNAIPVLEVWPETSTPPRSAFS